MRVLQRPDSTDPPRSAVSGRSVDVQGFSPSAGDRVRSRNQRGPLAVRTGRIVLFGGCLLGAFLASSAQSASATSVCCGDCDSDGAIRIDELVRGVSEALDGCDAACCHDCNLDRRVTVDELVNAVRVALDGCVEETPPSATPTRLPTATPTAPPVGPEITFFGLARADNHLLVPDAVTATGVPVYTRAFGSGFVLVVEARPGSSRAIPGIAGTRGRALFDSSRPDLQIYAERSLGNGSEEVCDAGARPGGVPGVGREGLAMRRPSPMRSTILRVDSTYT